MTVIWHGEQYARQFKSDLKRAVVTEMESVIGEGMGLAPVLNGDLMRSGDVHSESDREVWASFGGDEVPYGLKQHEEHASKSKFLERPFSSRDWPRAIARRMR